MYLAATTAPVGRESVLSSSGGVSPDNIVLSGDSDSRNATIHPGQTYSLGTTDGFSCPFSCLHRYVSKSLYPLLLLLITVVTWRRYSPARQLLQVYDMHQVTSQIGAIHIIHPPFVEGFRVRSSRKHGSGEDIGKTEERQCSLYGLELRIYLPFCTTELHNLSLFIYVRLNT